MKYRQEARQIAALGRTLRNIEGYKNILKPGVSPEHQAEFLARVVSKPEEVEEMSVQEVRQALEDKLVKAEKCVENLKAKDVALE